MNQDIMNPVELRSKLKGNSTVRQQAFSMYMHDTVIPALLGHLKTNKFKLYNLSTLIEESGLEPEWSDYTRNLISNEIRKDSNDFICIIGEKSNSYAYSPFCAEYKRKTKGRKGWCYAKDCKSCRIDL